MMIIRKIRDKLEYPNGANSLVTQANWQTRIHYTSKLEKVNKQKKEVYRNINHIQNYGRGVFI